MNHTLFWPIFLTSSALILLLCTNFAFFIQAVKVLFPIAFLVGVMFVVVKVIDSRIASSGEPLARFFLGCTVSLSLLVYYFYSLAFLIHINVQTKVILSLELFGFFIPFLLILGFLLYKRIYLFALGYVVSSVVLFMSIKLLKVMVGGVL